MMGRRSHHLRRDFETAVLAAIEQHGDGFDRAPLLHAAIEGGVSQATAYRWLSAVLETWEASPDHASSALPPPEPLAGAGQPLPSTLAAPASPVSALPGLVAGNTPPAAGWSEIMAALAQCEQATNHALAEACGPDMRIRDNRSLLQASNQLRRTLETAVNFVEAVEAQPGADGFRCELAAAVTEVAHGLRQGIWWWFLEFQNKSLGSGA